jgi:membrane fusion protein (multidrug efflux system)
VITSGLAANDQVIVSGLQQVKEGAPAKATPWQPDAAPSPAANGGAAAKRASPAAGGNPPAGKQ